MICFNTQGKGAMSTYWLKGFLDDANIVGYAASSQDALLSPPQRPRLWDMTLPRMSFQMAAILTTISLATVLI